MRTDAYDFGLPGELIAQHPSKERSASRLLLVDRASRSVSHHTFSELSKLLPGPLHFFRNNVSVIRARLRAFRPTGGAVECVLLEPSDSDALEWKCLVKPGRKLPIGATFAIKDVFQAEVCGRDLTEGTAQIVFALQQHASVVEMADALGELPLPPYIKRDHHVPEDNSRYQTVYADRDKRMAAAAPTAGLHFTEAILRQLEREGHFFHDLTLRVGLGTFRPVKTDNIEDHPIHRERYWVPSRSYEALHDYIGKRIAVGTTSVRSIEDCLRNPQPDLKPGLDYSREADLFIIPPYQFRGVDHMITNFHLPRSTLFGLVAAFLTPGSEEGVEWLKAIYAEAIREKYRFFSYGDAMLIL
ncbi:MAG: tRNA preQ1(34) S-adenosylmethionine ribosyltransferase-isomerase QueA [Verrucomicrobiota bacterium]